MARSLTYTSQAAQHKTAREVRTTMQLMSRPDCTRQRKGCAQWSAALLMFVNLSSVGTLSADDRSIYQRTYDNCQ